MPAFFEVSFARSICGFDGFGTSSFCDIWQWKLDPYRCRDHMERHRDVTFRNLHPEERIPDISRKVYEVQDGFFLRQIFLLADGATLWRYVRKITGEILLSYVVNPDWSEIVLVQDHSNSSGNMAFEYLCHIFPVCGLKQNILTFHGALVEERDRGFILSAASGVGKTTHARLWRDGRDALILNGDRGVCRKVNGVWTGFGLPWSGTSGEEINRSVPVKAIVVLERAERNRAVQIQGEEAFAGVLPHMLCPVWNAELSAKAMDLLADFLEHIPVIRLQCRPDLQSVEELKRVLDTL